MTIILGTNGADLLLGSNGDDAIYASGGNDAIVGGAGADDIFGGAGIDTARYEDSSTGVIVSLITGQGFNGTAEGDSLSSIENLTGSAYDDTLLGNDGNNVLNGASGNDTLKGGGGADTLDGGSGVDTADYSQSSAAVSVSLIGGPGSGGDAEGDLLSNIESLRGSAYADFLYGNDGSNSLWGNAGNDTLKGFGGHDYLYGGDNNDTLLGMDGNDNLYGGTGNDTLYGMDGNDQLHGDNGVDTIYGGAGLDSLWGGGGADVFRWDDTSETGTTIGSSDELRDFNRLEGDEINLAAIDADVYAPGNQAFTFIGNAAFSGTPGEIRYYQAFGNTYLEMQTGTSVDVEGVIRFDGLYTPDASWFLL